MHRTKFKEQWWDLKHVYYKKEESRNNIFLFSSYFYYWIFLMVFANVLPALLILSQFVFCFFK
jgi:hypothetical protein